MRRRARRVRIRCYDRGRSVPYEVRRCFDCARHLRVDELFVEPGRLPKCARCWGEEDRRVADRVVVYR